MQRRAGLPSSCNHPASPQGDERLGTGPGTAVLEGRPHGGFQALPITPRGERTKSRHQPGDADVRSLQSMHVPPQPASGPPARLLPAWPSGRHFSAGRWCPCREGYSGDAGHAPSEPPAGLGHTVEGGAGAAASEGTARPGRGPTGRRRRCPRLAGTNHVAPSQPGRGSKVIPYDGSAERLRHLALVTELSQGGVSSASALRPCGKRPRRVREGPGRLA